MSQSILMANTSFQGSEFSNYLLSVEINNCSIIFSSCKWGIKNNFEFPHLLKKLTGKESLQREFLPGGTKSNFQLNTGS